MEIVILDIRQERPTDYDAVYQVVKEAFANAEHTDGDEQIVGHILFTRAAVNGIEVLALAPLSVLSKYQNRGIGQSLIKQGHIIAQKMGYGYSVVLGHERYYPKSGYVPAYTNSI